LPIRFVLDKDLFPKCYLDGGDRIEFNIKDARSALLAEGVDFYKGKSVSVKKILMPRMFPDTFDKFGREPEKKGA